MLPNIGMMEMLLIFALALLIFGPKKLPEMGAAIGKSITSFRKGMKDVTSTDERREEKPEAITEQSANLKKQELEQLERDIAARKAALNAEPVAISPDQERIEREIAAEQASQTNKTTVEVGKDESKKA